MIEIALTVCSIIQGASCRDVTLTFEDQNQLVTPFACMMTGQFEIAKWMDDHPNWQVSKWACGVAGQIARI